MNYILQFIYSMWVLVLLLSCTSKKDSNTQATLDISEAKHLQWVDSVLGVKGVKLIDYRNRIYQYNDTRFYWNRTFDYFLVYPSSFTHGEESDLSNGNHFVNEDSTICLNVYATYFDVFKDDYSLHEWFDIMIDTEIEQGNRIVKKDITEHSYINTKGGRCFYSKAICKKAYEREVIVTMKLQYTDSRRKEVEKLLPNIFKYISINK